MARGQILGFSIGFRSRPYNTLALPCECVINEDDDDDNDDDKLIIITLLLLLLA